MRLGLELKVGLCHVDGPGELVPLALVVDFVYEYLHVLTPEHRGKRLLHCKINNNLSQPVNFLLYQHVVS